MLALVVDTSLSGMQVARELDRLVTDRGRPRMIVSDNGSEFTSNAILTWADQRKNSLSGSRASWFSNQASRDALTSSRACSAAWIAPFYG